VFTEELTNRGELGDVQLHSSNGVDGDELMEAFELGEREAFFEIWDKMLPEEAQSKDPVTLNLEFNISLYFAVYGYCSGQEHKVSQCTPLGCGQQLLSRGVAFRHQSCVLP
jgi:hypothetical protein